MASLKHIIFKFSKDADISSWKVIGDFVMGGVSNGNLKINENGNGVFFGEISLENNGGFSLLKYRFNKISVSRFHKIIFEIKGDNNYYQFRIKDSLTNSHSYVKSDKTSNKWEQIEINLFEMIPMFRGRKLEMNNFSSDYIEEVAILIGNKKEQSFQLEIGEIYLQ